MISVLMSTYKGENPKYLSECLESLYKQSLKPHEIILIKDGELLIEHENIINEYMNKLNLRTFLYEGASNLGGALRLGLEKCSYNVIARMDTDDICKRDRLKEQFHVMDSENLDILGCNVEEFKKIPGDMKKIKESPLQITKNIYLRNPINHMGVMFRKDKILKIGSYMPIESFEDWYLWLRAFKAGLRMKNLPMILVFARTDSTFIDRRSGLHYSYRELKALNLFYKEGLMPLGSYLVNLFFRVPLRLLPKKIFDLFYKKILRR